jgi:histidyl-tRNA synthetase
MTAGAKIERPRGTHDVVPAEQPLWRLVVGEAEQLCALYGYRPIVTPVFEDTALFERTSGPGSDVVQKEMYTFEDRGGRSLTLRPDATAPICRAYVEHGMHRDPQPAKLYTVAPIHRYAAPQRGRYREHWQLSVEAIGSEDPSIDAEVIQLYHALLTRLGVTELSLAVNSIGCRECRPAYLEQLGEWLAGNLSRLDEQTREKAAASPLRIFDNLEAKPASVREALAEAPTIGDSLCDACREHFMAVRRDLDAYGVPYEVVSTLVRGLDYYTRTTWEFSGPEAGAQSTLSGGGRYDGLVEEIGGPPTPGVGFGAGIERLLLALEHAGVTASPPVAEVFFVIEPGVDGSDRSAALEQMRLVRAAGFAADADFAERSRKGQLTQAGRSGARWLVDVSPGGVLIHPRADDQGTSRPSVRIEEIAVEVVKRLSS